jgi:hypothetical protein
VLARTPLPPQLSLASPQLSSQRVQDIQAVAAQQRGQLGEQRQQRGQAEEDRGAAAARLRRAEAVLRGAHQARLAQRQQLLQQAGVQVRAACARALMLLVCGAARS